MKEKFYTIGKRLPRKEAVMKATGALKYTTDIYLSRMLYARILRSPYPHAWVKKIDTSEAERLPGVKAIITHKDVPKIPCVKGYWKNEAIDSYILEEKARHIGDRIAAVAATSLDAAQKAIELIDVKYEELPAVFDPIEAMKPGAPRIHETVVFPHYRGERIEVKNNILGTVEKAVGDVEKGFKDADLIVEEEYKTPRQLHVPIEPRDTVCVPEPDGRLNVWATNQGVHAVRRGLSLSLGMPLHRINVHQVFVGGSFGRGTLMNVEIPICALLALKTGRPVKWEPSREDDAYENHRELSVIKLKMGVKRDGTLTAQEIKVVDDLGAYSVSALGWTAIKCGFYFSYYRCPNTKFDGIAVYTNTPPASAMRGAGAPQLDFAIESHMDIVAEELGIDPIELKLKNYVREGDLFYGQGPAIASIVGSCGVEYLIRKGAELIGWERRKRLPKGRGIGMAWGFHTSGCGSPKPAYITEYSGAIVKVNEDGTANLTVALVDPGTGNQQVLAQIVAEELGIKYEDVIVSEANTDVAPYNVIQHASRSTYSVGGVVKAAAAEAKKNLLKWAAKMLEVSVDELEVKDQKVCVKGAPQRAVTVGEVATYADLRTQQLGTMMGSYSGRPLACPPHYTAYFVELEVDMETGEIRVVNAVGGADVGVVISPDGAEAQIGGGLHMGIGYALTEKFLIDEATGEVLNPLLTDYKILTAADMPDLRIFFADTVEPTGPFGAKSLGEGAFNPVAAAVANAIYHATGIRIKELPITPEKILAALKKEK